MTQEELLLKSQRLKHITPNYLIMSFDTKPLFNYLSDMYSILKTYRPPVAYPTPDFINVCKYLFFHPSFPYNPQTINDPKLIANFKKYDDYYLTLYPELFGDFNSLPQYMRFMESNDSRFKLAIFVDRDLYYPLCRDSLDLIKKTNYKYKAFNRLVVSSYQHKYYLNSLVFAVQRHYDFYLFASRCYIMHYRFLRRYYFKYPKKYPNLFYNMSKVKTFAKDNTKQKDKVISKVIPKLIPFIKSNALKKHGTFKFDINENHSNYNHVFSSGDFYA